MSLEAAKKAKRQQDMMSKVLSFGGSPSVEEEDMDFTKDMIGGLGQASMASATPVSPGADQTGNTIQKIGGIAGPMMMAGKGAAAGAGAGAASGGGLAALNASGLSAGATTGAAAGSSGLGTAGTMAALSNPVTAAAIIGGTMLAGGLAQNQANKDARERGAKVSNYQRQSEIAMDTARQKQNAFNQLMQGYSAALR